MSTFYCFSLCPNKIISLSLSKLFHCHLSDNSCKVASKLVHDVLEEFCSWTGAKWYSYLKKEHHCVVYLGRSTFGSMVLLHSDCKHCRSLIWWSTVFHPIFSRNPIVMAADDGVFPVAYWWLLSNSHILHVPTKQLVNSVVSA